MKDSDNVVDSVNGHAALVDAEDDPVTGEGYAIVSGALDPDDAIEDTHDETRGRRGGGFRTRQP